MVLVGSGLSRAASIPTGWEVTLDLIKRAAIAESQQSVDPEVWYRGKFGKDPDYSLLLNELGKTSSERQAILRQYFEPTDEDKATGKKLPTTAHKAIATLVAKGFIRVIVTTNFDRLLEQALETEGVMPMVISSADAAQGATPLAHTRCTVIKLHGDYLDIRIKNTAEELSSYDQRFSALMDRIFDEYGLIICGWSGTWDTALVQAIQRISTRRYTTFWAVRGIMTQAAQDLARLRSAVVMPISDADVFFKELLDRVLSIAEFGSEHPLTTISAAASLKRFLQDPAKRIDLHDLVINEARRMKSEVDSLILPADAPTKESIFHRLQQYEAIAERPVAIFSNLAFFAEKTHHPLIVEAVRWFISPAQPRTSYNVYLNERLHSAVLVFYAMAVAAVRGDKPELLKLLFLDTKVRKYENSPEEPAICHRLSVHVMDHGIAQTFPGYERHRAPMADRYFDILQPMLANIFPTERDFASTFHIVEVLASLSYLDQILKLGETHPWAPAGRFLYYDRDTPDTVYRLKAEAERDYAGSTIGRSGLFLSAERFNIVYQRFTEIMTEYPRY